METAQHIAVHNQKVAIVEMLPEIAADMEGGAKHFTLESLKNNDVAIYVNTKVIEIKDDSVVVDTADGSEEIPANLVVLAVGSTPNNHLAGKVSDQYPTSVIGDAVVVGKALDGINTAYALALEI